MCPLPDGPTKAGDCVQYKCVCVGYCIAAQLPCKAMQTVKKACLELISLFYPSPCVIHDCMRPVCGFTEWVPLKYRRKCTSRLSFDLDKSQLLRYKVFSQIVLFGHFQLYLVIENDWIGWASRQEVMLKSMREKSPSCTLQGSLSVPFSSLTKIAHVA